MELRGRVAVITGASSGIGRALSIALAKSGCRLLLTALEKDELDSVTEYLVSHLGAEVSSMPADLVIESDRQNFLEWLRACESPPDLLINNAGGGYFGRFTSSQWCDIERTLLLNIHIPIFLTRELLPILLKRPRAKIVNISSAIARLPYPGLSAYGAAKGFLSSFSESLACELAGTNVSVLCFHPGFTDTHFMSTAGMDMSRIPKFLISTPETVANRIVMAIKKDKTWAYSDFNCRLGISIAGILPHRLKIKLFKNIFWRFPDEQ